MAQETFYIRHPLPVSLPLAAILLLVERSFSRFCLAFHMITCRRCFPPPFIPCESHPAKGRRGGYFIARKKSARMCVRRLATFAIRLYLLQHDVKQYERALFIYSEVVQTIVATFNDGSTWNFMKDLAQNNPPPRPIVG